jgi:(2Fe-2S) ferredoxin
VKSHIRGGDLWNCFLSLPLLTGLMRYDYHIFVCANQKAEGKKCCTEAFGMEVVEKLRAKIREAGLPASIRVQRAGCLDLCGRGPALVVYPQGIFYGGITLDMLDDLVDHLRRGAVMEAYQIPDPA